jgi:hypothetical protein
VTAQHLSDCDGAAPMDADAWGLHAIAAMSDADARRLLSAPAGRPFSGARLHLCPGPMTEDDDAERAPGQPTSTAASRTGKETT